MSFVVAALALAGAFVFVCAFTFAFAGARLRRPLAGPLAARASSNPTASTIVRDSGSEPCVSDALVVPSVT